MADRGKWAEGVVEAISFTSGGAGNQWTTIGGVKYATWWDARDKDWKQGDRVRFRVRSGPLFDGDPPILQAWEISKCVEPAQAPAAPDGMLAW